MGEGARRGFAFSLIVADRRGLFLNGAVLSVGETAVFGGGGGRPPVSSVGFTKAELLRESLRRRLVPRSFFGSENAAGAFWEKRLATVVLVRRA